VIFSIARRRFKIATVVAKATSSTNFEPITKREEIAAVRRKNEFFKVPIILLEKKDLYQIDIGPVLNQICCHIQAVLLHSQILA